MPAAVELADGTSSRRRNGRVRNGKRARDRPMVRVATLGNRGRPHIPAPLDNRRLVERFASWVYICVERNATELSQHAIHLYSSKGGKTTKTYLTRSIPSAVRNHLKTLVPQRITREAVEIEDHPFLDLMEYVNPILDFCGLMWLTSAYLQLDGNAYWHVAEDSYGVPIELWVLPSQYVFPIYGQEQVIDAYQLRYGHEFIELPAGEVIHFRKPSPLDMVSGLGNLKGILFAAETNLRMQEWENAVFTNYCMPDFMISPHGDFSADQTKQLQADWQQSYGGWRQRGRMAVAPFEFKIEKLTMSAKDLQYKDGRIAIMEEIAAGFGVPMNIVRNDGITFNNMRHGKQLWVTSTIKPLMKTISSGLNTYMMPRYSGGNGIETPDTLPRRSPWFVAFDNPVPEDIDADAQRLVSLSGGVPLVTPNEARAELGREPAEWGDEPFIPGGVRRPSEPIAGAQFPDGATLENPEGETETTTVDGESGDVDPNDKLSELMMALERAVTMNDTEIVNALRSRIGALLGASVTPVDDIKPATTITAGIINPDQAHIDIVEEQVNGAGDNGQPGKPGEPKPAEAEEGEAEGEQEQAEADDNERERRKKSAASAGADPDDVCGRGEARQHGTGAAKETAIEGQDDAAGDEDGRATELSAGYLFVKALLEDETDPDRKDPGFVEKLRGLLDRFSTAVREKFAQLFEGATDLAELSKTKLLEMLFDRSEWSQKFADEAFEFTARAFDRGGALGLVDLQNAGIAIETDVQLPPDQVEKHVRRLTEHFASTVVQVTGDDVYKAVSDGLKAGENVYGISDRLAAVYGAKKDTAAERIARTELNRALNAGAQSMWKEAGVSQNEWLASVDACEFCVAMNGKRVELGKPFAKAGVAIRGVDGGTFTPKYGDVLHPTLHPHCTCTIVPVKE